jgi:IMP dehydrogenase
MMGRLFAATEEAPGEIITFAKDKVPARFRSIMNGAATLRFKSYRGMGSIGAMERGKQISSEDEFHGKSYDDNSILVAEGVEGLVPCSGELATVVATMLEGVRSGFYYVGASSIAQLWDRAVMSTITTASLSESHPHDLFVTEAGNSYPT